MKKSVSDFSSHSIDRLRWLHNYYFSVYLEIDFSSTVRLYDENEIEMDLISDVISGSISTIPDENEDYQLDISLDSSDDDGNSDISNITDAAYDADQSNDDSSDGDYDMRSDSGFSFDTSNQTNESDISSDENDQSSSSDNEYDTNGKTRLINNNDNYEDGRSLLIEITDEINDENDRVDDDDRWSDITHITYEWPEGDELTSNDEGYDSNSQNDSSVDDEQGILLEVYIHRSTSDFFC